MKYTQTTPCNACPFLKKMSRGFTLNRLHEFADSGTFACHKTCDVDDDGEGDFVATNKSVACAGALIFLEKRDTPNQMMRISERLGMYDRRLLNMKADVR